jgi:hypothetical protein
VNRSLSSFVPALALSAGMLWSCSKTEEPDGIRWPTRNYGGIYAVRVGVSADDCQTPGFTERDSLVVTLVHSPDNQARFEVSPVVSLSGTFEGDRLYSGAAVAHPGAAAAEAAGELERLASLDSIRYRLEADFEGQEFEAKYEVEQPGFSGVKACRQVYDLKGARVAGRRPEGPSPAVTAPGDSR